MVGISSKVYISESFDGILPLLETGMDLSSIGLHTNKDFLMGDLFVAIQNDKKRDGDSLYYLFIRRIEQVYAERISINNLKELAYDLC